MRTWDLVVMGGGPAGASAALVAGTNGLRTCLLEAGPALGGQLHWADAPILDVLGHPRASGPELAASFEPQLLAAGVELRTNTRVDALDRAGDGLLVRLEGGETLRARRVLLATGLRRRTLGVEGEALTEQARSPRLQAEAYRGRRVVVVGGGDEAADTARGLGAVGARVTLLARAALRARPTFARPLRAEPAVSIWEGAKVARIVRTEDGALRVELEDGRRLEADAVFVRIGAEPQLPRLGFELRRYEDGRIAVERGGQTSAPGVFAAGDLVYDRGERYVSMAMGSGAVAARAIEATLEGP